MVKQTIILRKRANSKVVNLPDGRSFTSKWERISRKQLIINIRVKRQGTIDPRRNNRIIYLNQVAPALKRIKKRRRKAIYDKLGPIYDRVQQDGKGFGSDLGSKALGSEFEKKLINKGIDSIPNIFKFGASKVRNKNVERAMGSDIADMIVQEVQNRAKNKYNSLFD